MIITTKTGSVLFDKISKCFDDGEGGRVEDISDAYVYQTHKDAENDLLHYDEPEIFEIWDIEINYKTI